MESTTVLAIASFSLIAVLVVFTGGLMLNFSEHRLADRKLSALNQRIVNLREEERSRVSRELHDGISQHLVSIKFQFELASLELENGQGKGLENLRAGTARLGEAIGEIRRISHDLRPSLLDTLGLSPAIEQLVREFEQRTGVRTQYERGLDDSSLDMDVRVTLFRIIQEALSNVHKHAKADRVSIQLDIDLERLRVTITDNGVGFDMETVLRDPEKWDHFGIKGILERARLVGGEGRVESKKGQGTKIIVEVPLMKKEEQAHGENQGLDRR